MIGRTAAYIAERRFIRGHQNRGQTRRRRREWLFDIDYFDVIDCGHETACWIWQRALSQKGYGVAWSATSKRYMPAHRAVWEERLGPLPEGVQTRHLCGMRACVNPSHIKPVGLGAGQILVTVEADVDSQGRAAAATARSQREQVPPDDVTAPIK